MLRKSVEATGDVSSNNSTTTPLLLPGDPGRWALPDDPSGLDALFDLHSSLFSLSDIQVAYNLSTCLSLLILIVRLISLATIQPRLAIIPLSLLESSKDLLHLLSAIVPLTVMWAALLVVTAGAGVRDLNNLLDATGLVFTGCVTGNYTDLTSSVIQQVCVCVILPVAESINTT